MELPLIITYTTLARLRRPSGSKAKKARGAGELRAVSRKRTGARRRMGPARDIAVSDCGNRRQTRNLPTDGSRRNNRAQRDRVTGRGGVAWWRSDLFRSSEGTLGSPRPAHPLSAYNSLSGSRFTGKSEGSAVSAIAARDCDVETLLISLSRDCVAVHASNVALRRALHQPYVDGSRLASVVDRIL